MTNFEKLVEGYEKNNYVKVDGTIIDLSSIVMVITVYKRCKSSSKEKLKNNINIDCVSTVLDLRKRLL